ncbi:MAG: hypothetical protein IJS09_05835 [Treponema sp.]|nr:hypothetical protein [Treponema sp.]
MTQSTTQEETTKSQESQRWYEVEEAHNSVGLAVTFALLKILPAVVLRIIAFPVGFFYWLFGKKARAFSTMYLQQLNSFLTAQESEKKIKISTLKHFLSFAIALTEKIEVWAGKFSFKQIHFQNDDIEDLVHNLENGKGVMLFVSHLGNSELLRGLANAHETGVKREFIVNSILDVQVTAGFNALLKKVNADATMHIFNASEIGPDTMILLQQKAEAGEMIVIAGDRTSASTQNRFVTQDFLGKPAQFAYGSYMLAALLNIPTYFVFGVRQKDVSISPLYNFHVRKSPVNFDCPRKERDERIRQTVAAYAQTLEKLCIAYPYQWYNFFNFWADA